MEEEQQNCKYIYKNIIELMNLNSPQPMNSCSVIREIESTKKCDCLYPEFAIVRKAFFKKLGQKRYDRILNFKPTPRDEVIANRCVLHYYTWTVESAKQTLPFWSRIYYETVYRWKYTSFIQRVSNNYFGT